MTKKNEADLVLESASTTLSKEQLLKSRRYRSRRDLLCALLEDGRRYSRAEVDALIDEFMKRGVS